MVRDSVPYFDETSSRGRLDSNPGWSFCFIGTILECLEELRGHGIDPSCIPVNDKGNMTDLFEDRQRLEEQRQQERLKYPTRRTIAVPFCEDVLLGKGRALYFRFILAIKSCESLYQIGTRSTKGQKKERRRLLLVESLMSLRAMGGYFLSKMATIGFQPTMMCR